jgi:Na+-transporting NADH:ubiquinone oxidoreductase subunit C
MHMLRKLVDVLFILVLGTVSASALIGIRRYTLPRIERYQETKLKTTILEAAGISYDAGNVDEVFQKHITRVGRDTYEYYLGPNNRYVFEFRGRGLWGMIEGVIVLDQDTETLKAVRIVSQEETPGLGARISEASFLNQFAEKRISPQLNLVLRRKATESDEVDAISGATLSSEALVRIINESADNFRNNLRK